MATANDRAVLNHILNPLMPTDCSSLEGTIADDAPITADGIEESRALEKEGVVLAEGGDLENAIQKFDEAIRMCSVNPSAFNNRAQALRLQGRPQGLNRSTSKTDQQCTVLRLAKEFIIDALSDLDQAISLSNGSGRSACQAFVQRAMIHRLRGSDDLAKADFQKAAELGSTFAKMQVVSLNPYAAMCNKMLSEIFSDLKKGKSD
ncbi:unnamed protein product [Heligmosomoides polygyrus]|uniref:TPR_REGION domain-containing protein n=1 Tax=Heligmosomoides polygyrus TaxID=6339 RepID=A0A183GPP3_HELPZ|nr:unnamed protein product [Heligmosomoides polygyrus]